MRILLPTMRDVGQVGGTTTHLDMLSRGLNEIGHEAHVLYLGAKIPAAARNLGIVWPAGALNRARRGWGMVYASWLRGQVISRLAERELARDAAQQAQTEPPGRGWEVLNAQDVYSVPGLRVVADRFSLPLVLTLHGYPLYESLSEGYTS
ncbi:MAG: glycosyltransferase family 4 protein, partial [Gaiellales bacterium]|nr:glycosyltransferase family 4 protein [Gaiellales bacterium]